MLRTISISLLLQCSISTPQVLACTILTLATNGEVFMGNNEDFKKRGAVWFVAGEDGKLGRVNFGFHNLFGKREEFAQGSMNERGLAFDAAVTQAVEWHPDPKLPTPNKLLELIMDTCSTVDEAILLFRENNCHYLASSQFMFADATGASAVITWSHDNKLSVLRREGDWQVCTNTRMQNISYRCVRWTKASQILQADGSSGIATVRKALQAVHQHGKGFTSYSCIYDLKRQVVYVYNLTNFDEVVQLDLKSELAKGASSHLLKKLFKNSPTIQEVTSKEQRIDYETQVTLSQDALQKFAGHYASDTVPSMPVQVVLNDGGLKVVNEGRPDANLFAESDHVFRIAPDRGQVTFEVADGKVIGLTLHKLADVFARRIRDSQQ